MDSDSNNDLIQTIERLRASEKDLTNKVNELTQVIIENGLEEEIGAKKTISVEEQICLDGISYLAKIFQRGTFVDADTKMFDVLHKNLRLIRGQYGDEDKKKTKPANVKELLSIVTEKKSDN